MSEKQPTKRAELRLDARIELNRAALHQLTAIADGLRSEIVECLGILIALRPASADELLLLSDATKTIDEVIACVDAIKLQLRHQGAELELAQREAAALHVAAYGAPA